jgi:hypothetical protein
VEISLKGNIKEFTKHLTMLEKQQVPYATSRAINDTAVDGQESVQEAIPHIFNNRKRWWLKQQPTGIKVKFSNKQNLHAKIHTSAYFAKLQSEGGIKTPKTARNLAIPTEAVPRKYRTSHGAKEMSADRANVFRTPKGVFKRSGKKKITLLWSFSPSATIKRVFNFHEIIEKVVKRRFEQHFKKRLTQALSSAKPPSR